MTDIKKSNALIKQVFGKHPNLVQLMQSLFLGFELTSDEKELIKSTFTNDELFEAIRRRIAPRLERDTIVGQQSDEWAGLETDIYGSHPDKIYQAVHYKKEAIAMANKAVALLRNPDGEQIDISFDPDSKINDPLQIKLLARNMYIKMIQNQLSTIWIISEQKEGENPQQTAERILKDSAK
jgi:hypothetical protein